MSAERALIAVAGRDLAGDVGTLFEIAADDQIGGGRAGAVGLQVGPVAPIEVSNELGASLARRRLRIEQRLHLGTPLGALVGAAEAAQVVQAAENFGKPRQACIKRRRYLGGGRRGGGVPRNPADDEHYDDNCMYFHVAIDMRRRPGKFKRSGGSPSSARG